MLNIFVVKKRYRRECRERSVYYTRKDIVRSESNIARSSMESAKIAGGNSTAGGNTLGDDIEVFPYKLYADIFFSTGFGAEEVGKTVYGKSDRCFHLDVAALRIFTAERKVTVTDGGMRVR